jgi:hypothetical protein
MRTYARIEGGRVAEFFSTASDIRQLFHPSLVWVDLAGQADVKLGWTFDGKTFAAPATVVPQKQEVLTVAELQRRLELLSAQIDTLMGR